MKGHDVYAKSAYIRYTLIVTIVVWVVAFLMAGVLITNAKFEVSICEPAGGPCTPNIYSDLWSSNGWVATSMFGANCFFVMAYLMLLTFGRNRLCANAWIGVMMLVWIVNMVSWVGLLAESINCNRPNAGNRGNICTSLEACLVPEFFNDPANGCPNSPFGARAYTLQLSDLHWRSDFKWLFGAVTLFTFVLNLIVMLFVFIVWCGAINVRSTRLAKKTQ
jgi:hypothetical protein